jgi:hypothetical protein
VPVPVGTLAPEPLQPRAPLSLEPLLDDAIAFGAPALDLGSARLLLALPLCPLPLETFRDRFPAPERDYLGVASAEATRGHRPTLRASTGDAIVASEPHAARV